MPSLFLRIVAAALTKYLMFYVPGATAGTVQWKAETFQLVNWGGFEGRVVFDFHPGSTLIQAPPGPARAPCWTLTSR